MITAEELQGFALFDSLSDEWRKRIADTAAELLVSEGEWIIREGETPSFFVLLSGALNCEKDFGAANKVIAASSPGDFHGEIPILLDSVTVVSLRATRPSRLLRLDRVQFQDMIASSRRCNELVMDIMTKRLQLIQEYMQVNDSTRVRVVGSPQSAECRDIRDFLSRNHIAYRWSNHDHAVSKSSLDSGEPFVLVDQSKLVTSPLTVRKVAHALGMNTVPADNAYDLVIVGGGPAGLAAAVSASSEGLSVLVIEKRGIGGQAACSTRIENYPGFPTGICGNELASKALRQAVHFGAEITMTRDVECIYPTSEGYRVRMDGDCSVRATSILLATGVQWKTLSVPGLKPLLGRGVLYGAARTEAHMVKGKRVFIVGAGNSAGQAAMFFSSYASSVTLLVRGGGIRSSMSQYLVNQLQSKANIHVEANTELISTSGDTQLESICTGSRGTISQREADALFVMIGACAASDWMPVGLQRDPEGFVYTGPDVRNRSGLRKPFLLETSLEGVFCAGDIRHDSIKRVSSAMGEGSMAVAFIHQYLALASLREEALA